MTATLTEISQGSIIQYEIWGASEAEVNERGQEFLEKAGYGYSPFVTDAVERHGKWYARAHKWSSCD